jgi:DNA repair protein RecO (recombination protein O)
MSAIIRGTKTSAVVLRSVDVFDADRSYLMLTRVLGKIRARAKGVRRPTSKTTGHLLAYVPTEVEVQESGGYFLITSAQSQYRDAYPEHDLAFLRMVEIAAEGIDRLLLESEPHPSIFDAFVSVLDYLRSDPQELLVAEFLFKTVVYLGYKPELDHCSQSGAPLEKDRLGWSSQGGGVYNLTENARAELVDPRVIVALRQMVHPDFISDRLQMPHTARAQTLQVIYDYVQTIIGAPLRSVSFNADLVG